jgi:hypothetical protein
VFQFGCVLHPFQLFYHFILLQEATQDELGFGYAKGPIASSLDSILLKYSVDRKPYFGKCFVGNHIKKLCTVSYL